MTVPFLISAFAPAPAARHLHLLASTPAADATLNRSPSEIRLIFSARVTVASLNLHEAGGRRAALGRVKLSVSPRVSIGQGPDSVVHNAGVVVAVVPQTLKPGRYELRWKAAGSDGHAVHNHFAFTVGRTAVPGR